MHYDHEKERYVMDVPTHCPRCGAELEVDTRYADDASTIKTFLICTNENCDYELDATEEFEKTQEAYFSEDDEE